jgi:hypothetical protein
MLSGVGQSSAEQLHVQCPECGRSLGVATDQRQARRKLAAHYAHCPGPAIIPTDNWIDSVLGRTRAEK